MFERDLLISGYIHDHQAKLCLNIHSVVHDIIDSYYPKERIIAVMSLHVDKEAYYTEKSPLIDQCVITSVSIEPYQIDIKNESNSFRFTIGTQCNKKYDFCVYTSQERDEWIKRIVKLYINVCIVFQLYMQLYVY